jgi:peptidoglycan/xylan/chitin deacetylase (PgdA/CDA1 family)
MSTIAKQRLDRPGVSLTFDDGPDSRDTPLVLDELERAGARATFFVTPGSEPELIERMAEAGHEVAYHCGRHVRHSERTRREVLGEARSDLGWVGELGIRPRAWRTPWGDLAPWTGELAAGLGMELWGWSDDTEDWSGRPSGEMLADLERSIAPGSVVLMHDGVGPGARRRDCGPTVELVAPLVELCRERDLDLEPINPTEET